MKNEIQICFSLTQQNENENQIRFQCLRKTKNKNEVKKNQNLVSLNGTFLQFQSTLKKSGL